MRATTSRRQRGRPRIHSAATISDFQQLVDSFCAADASGAEQASAQASLNAAVQSGALTLQSLVSLLGAQLTSLDDVARGRGTELLATVLESLAARPIAAAQLGVLIDFFVARLDDYAGVDGVLRGLLALLRRRALATNELVGVVARGLFHEVRVQALAQATRQRAFELFDVLLDDANVRAELGGEFTFALLQACDGEKDPRNLLLVFALLERVGRDGVADWKRYAEDVFELTTCYFPITFRQRPDDPQAVTQEQLVAALRRCMTHPSLASFVVPFLLEKLDDGASSAATARECVATLLELLLRAKREHGDATAIAARNEPPVTDEAGQLLVEGATEVHAAAIGSAVMAQIVTGSDVALVDACVDAVARACSALTRGAQLDAQPQSLLANFLAQVVPIAAANVERDSTLPRVRLDSGRAAAAACRGAEASCMMVLRDILKPLLARTDIAVATVRRADVALAAAIVDAIAERVHADAVGAAAAATAADFVHPLLPYREPLLDLFRGALLHDPTSATRAAALAGLGALGNAGKPTLLDDATRVEIAERVEHHLLGDASGDVRATALRHLCDVLGNVDAVAYHATLARVTLRTVPTLLARAAEPLDQQQQQAKAAEDSVDKERPKRSLGALAQLALANASLYESITSSLAQLACRCIRAIGQAERKSDAAAVGDNGDEDDVVDDDDDDDDDDDNVADELLTLVLQSLVETGRRVKLGSAAAAHGEAAIVAPLIDALRAHAMRGGAARLDAIVMARVTATVTARIALLDADAQRRVRAALLDGADVSKLVASGVAAQRQLIVLVSAVVRATALQCGLALAPGHTAALLDATMHAVRAAHECASDVQLALAYVLALLVNADAALAPPHELVQLAAAGNVAAATTLMWAIKAIMMRGGADASSLLVDVVVRQLLCGAAAGADVERMRDAVAAAFGGVLFADSDVALLVEKRFYKQKHFSLLLPAVLEEYRAQSSGVCSDRLLMVLCGALRHLPVAVVAQHCDTLAPLVSAAVRRSASNNDNGNNSNNNNNSVAAIEAVRALLATPNSTLTRAAADVQSLALALLAIACRAGAPAQQCAALNTLRELGDLVPYRSIFPTKQKILDDLARLLNDNKRAVRHEAARTRNAFAILGANIEGSR